MKCRTFREFELGYADHRYRGKKFFFFFCPRFSSCCSSKGKPSFRNVENSARQGILHFARIIIIIQFSTVIPIDKCVSLVSGKCPVVKGRHVHVF